MMKHYQVSENSLVDFLGYAVLFVYSEKLF